MSRLSGKHVLLVEDEYFLADELKEAIEAAGAIVLGPFAYVSEAREAAKAHVDAAVLNVRVRDGLIYPLAASLRERGIPFIFATGQESQTEPQEWQAATWMAKPYHPGDVVKSLMEALK